MLCFDNFFARTCSMVTGWTIRIYLCFVTFVVSLLKPSDLTYKYCVLLSDVDRVLSSWTSLTCIWFGKMNNIDSHKHSCLPSFFCRFFHCIIFYLFYASHVYWIVWCRLECWRELHLWVICMNWCLDRYTNLYRYPCGESNVISLETDFWKFCHLMWSVSCQHHNVGPFIPCAVWELNMGCKYQIYILAFALYMCCHIVVRFLKM